MPPAYLPLFLVVIEQAQRFSDRLARRLELARFKACAALQHPIHPDAKLACSRQVAYIYETLHIGSTCCTLAQAAIHAIAIVEHARRIHLMSTNIV